MTVPQVCLDPGDAVELGEMLEFLSEWLVCDHSRLADSLRRFVGSDGYDIDQLRANCPGSGSCLASPTANGASTVMHDDGVSRITGGRSPGGLASS